MLDGGPDTLKLSEYIDYIESDAYIFRVKNMRKIKFVLF